MTEVERQLMDELRQLEKAIAGMAKASPKPELMPRFQRIDELTAALPRGTDSSLLHYLHKKSYQKARLFLEGRDAQNQSGNCRHVG